MATLPPEQGAQLINGLTIGYGSLALAARRAAEDASVATVERAVAAAHDALVRAPSRCCPPHDRSLPTRATRCGCRWGPSYQR